MASLREKLLESENKTGHEMGHGYGWEGYVRTDVEDALVQALEDTLRSGRLDPFRQCVRKLREWVPLSEEWYTLVLYGQDLHCWVAVWWVTCDLKRMSPRWEHCANKLLQLGIQAPVGQTEMGF